MKAMCGGGHSLKLRFGAVHKIFGAISRKQRQRQVISTIKLSFFQKVEFACG